MAVFSNNNKIFLKVMSNEDKNEIIRLCSLTGKVSMLDKSSAQDLIQRYINPGAKYCMTCDSSVRAMFNQLKNWWLVNKDNY